MISTRLRGLLKGAAAVELKPPTDASAIKILMTAAEMPESMAPPKEAATVIDMCDRLPLALVMAGRLIAQLGLSTDWTGVTDILDEELRENEQTSSEQLVIKASLAGLKGSARDKLGINNLFAVFALVPEDTVCPIETLGIMYDALYNEGKAPVSLLHIRKWLKVLIDRSLVLGTGWCRRALRDCDDLERSLILVLCLAPGWPWLLPACMHGNSGSGEPARPCPGLHPDALQQGEAAPSPPRRCRAVPHEAAGLGGGRDALGRAECR
eukprot:SAG22_NODE_315_length_12535_cov_3.240351_14_plen_267_part_00